MAFMLFFLHVCIRALKIADIDCYKIRGAFGSTDTLTSIFIIVDMTKTSSNNCLLLYTCEHRNEIRNICDRSFVKLTVMESAQSFTYTNKWQEKHLPRPWSFRITN
jgi:hypothetical protein